MTKTNKLTIPAKALSHVGYNVRNAGFYEDKILINSPARFTVKVKFSGSKHSPDAAVKFGSTLHQAPLNSSECDVMILEQPRAASAQTLRHGERGVLLPSSQRGRRKAQFTATGAFDGVEQFDAYMLE